MTCVLSPPLFIKKSIMTIYSLVILPFVFGLVGFVEPCSMGINAIFLSSIERKNRGNRAKEITIFVLRRAFVLALIGVSAAFVGNKYFSFQQYFFIILASLYIIVGILMLFSKSLLGKLRDIRMVRTPACVIGNSVRIGNDIDAFPMPVRECICVITLAKLVNVRRGNNCHFGGGRRRLEFTDDRPSGVSIWCMVADGRERVGCHRVAGNSDPNR